MSKQHMHCETLAAAHYELLEPSGEFSKNVMHASSKGGRKTKL